MTDETLYYVRLLSPRNMVVLEVTGKRATILQLLVAVALDNTPSRTLFQPEGGSTRFTLDVMATRAA